jgi:hypothetical protein
MRPIRRLTPIRMVAACCTAVLLAAVVTATSVQAAAPALQAQLTLRPLTPQDIKDYALTNVPGIQGASGLSTVGKGQPAYLEVLVNNAVTNSDITNVTWVLTVSPGGSAALDPSPLGTNVPTYKMADRYNNSGAAVYKVPQWGGEPVRKLLRPDVTGLYTVTVTVQTKSSGSTNLTQNITASTYMGIGSCKLCHDGGTAPPKYEEWSQTPHATFFTRAINGLESDHYGKNCISCHTVGYDTNAAAVNDGFDDIATKVGWTFPATLTTNNWAAMPAQLQNRANIQCENCHGAGSEHAIGELDGLQRPEAKAAIAVSFIAGNCAQCHDSKPNHSRSAEWNNSKHAVATRTPSGPSRPMCARCHTASGFAAYTETLGTNNIVWTGTNVAFTTYEAITCASCHDPHNDENPHQLRAAESIQLADGAAVATITNAGAGSLCMNCHQSRSGSYTNSLVGYPAGKPTYAGGSSSFGPHDNPAADMIEGVNGYTYGKVIPSSAHAHSVSNTCAGCHMQAVASTDPAFTKAGGHTFSMTYTNPSGVLTEKVDVCIKCHGEIESFDMVKVDYNGDGIIEGVQTEVTKLYQKLSRLFPSSTYQSNPDNYVADGLVKSPSVKTNWPAKFLQAAWNYQLVANDLSKGVHNAAYAVGLLKASIGDLTGDNNNDTLQDSWQVQYFGPDFTTNAAAGPYGINNTNGIPNWMMYAMGLDPRSGLKVGNGVIYVNEGNVVNGDPNTIAIYTAAEIAFDTVVGTSYQIQGITALTGTWQNIGTNILGTGSTISYVTPTRGTQQMFYRVSHNP